MGSEIDHKYSKWDFSRVSLLPRDGLLPVRESAGDINMGHLGEIKRSVNTQMARSDDQELPGASSLKLLRSTLC